MDLFNLSGATLSPCKKYRYALWRKWDTDKPMVLFIMLNPSTADASRDDATIRRCMHMAHSWGYGGIHVANLYAYRSSDPTVLETVDDPHGPDNEQHLTELSTQVDKIICAWGNKQGWPARIIDHYEGLHYLAIAKDGTPKHPLYLKKTVQPIPFISGDLLL